MFGTSLRNHNKVSAGVETEKTAGVRVPMEGEDQLPEHGTPASRPLPGGEGDI